MESSSANEMWPLQRLLKMIQVVQAKDNELWKQSTSLSSIDSAQKDANSQHRDSIVMWISKLNKHFRFHHETFFLSTAILDRFMSSVKVQPKYLKCIGLSCLYLGSKITEEEDMIPRTGELVKESECGCRVCDVVRMERIILEKLSWSIQSSTALDYLHLFQALTFGHFTECKSLLSLPRRMDILAGVLTKLLYDSEIAKLPNAALSLALVSIELEALTSEPEKWMRVAGQLQLLSRVTTDDLMTCREHLLCRLPPRKSGSGTRSSKSSFGRFSLPSTVPLHETKRSSAQIFSTSGNGGGTKRKAATPSPTKIIELSKKPHPEIVDTGDGRCRTSSGQCSGKEDPSTSPCRRLTYAEIVKLGVNNDYHEKSDDGILINPDLSPASGDLARRCGLEANYSFLSPLSPSYNNHTSIKT